MATAGVYVVGLAVVLLAPSAELQTAVVFRTSDVLSVVLPDALVIPPRVEMMLNALMVVPLAFMVALVWMRSRWQDLTAYCFIGAWAVELLQAVVLAGRSATLTDVAANTSGAFAGAVLGVLVRRTLRDPSEESADEQRRATS